MEKVRSDNPDLDGMAIDAEDLKRFGQKSFAEQGNLVGTEATMLRNSGRRVACDFHRETKTNLLTMGCAHVLESKQDPVHPCGLVAMPRHYFVCKDCYRLIQQQHFNWEKEMMIQCWGCIMDFAEKLNIRNPDLLLDLTKRKD